MVSASAIPGCMSGQRKSHSTVDIASEVQSIFGLISFMNRSCLHALRLLPIGIVVLLAACDRPASDADPASEEPESTAPAAATPTADSRPAAEVREDPELRATKKKVVKTYADLVHANYSDALRTAKILRQAIGELIENPSEASLRSAQEAWRAARVPYLQTEVYRFYGGPIDNDEDGVEALLNAWPLDEGYIDYVRGNPDSGIIQNEEDYPEISQTLLVELNEKESVTNVSTGYHAIEFLLWGQDFSENGPGDRAYTDYVKAADGPGATAERRGDYLRAITDLLAEDLQSLVEAWSPDAQGNYREKFLAAPADDSVQKILQGMGMLAGYELSGERLSVPYETGAQEDERAAKRDHVAAFDHRGEAAAQRTRGAQVLEVDRQRSLSNDRLPA